MMLAISVIIFVLGFIKKKSKTFYFLQFSWMWVILCLCNDLARVDYQNYVMAFERHGITPFSISNVEFGYFLTDKILYHLGLSFEVANSIYVTFVLFIMYITIPKYTTYINIPASLFLFFPLLLNGIQIRNALSSAIVTFGLQFLLHEDKKDEWKYILCVGVAMLFHVTSMFYFLFLLIKVIKDYKKLLTWVLGMTVGILPSINIFSSLLQLLSGEARFNSKFVSVNSIFECLAAIIWILFLLFILSGINKSVLKNRCIKKSMHLGNFLKGITIISIILIPMFYIDFSFERLFRNWFIFVYCFIASFIEHHRKIRGINYNFYILCFGIWYVYSIVVFEVFLGNRVNVIIRVYLENNNLFAYPDKYYALMVLMIFVLFGVWIFEHIKVKLRIW